MRDHTHTYKHMKGENIRRLEIAGGLVCYHQRDAPRLAVGSKMAPQQQEQCNENRIRLCGKKIYVAAGGWLSEPQQQEQRRHLPPMVKISGCKERRELGREREGEGGRGRKVARQEVTLAVVGSFVVCLVGRASNANAWRRPSWISTKTTTWAEHNAGGKC